MWWGLMVGWFVGFVGWLSLGGTPGWHPWWAADLSWGMSKPCLCDASWNMPRSWGVETCWFAWRAPRKKTRTGGKSPYEDTMRRIRFVEWAIRSTQFESQSKIQIYKINPKICQNTIDIEFVGIFLCNPMDWKLSTFPSGPRCRSTSQASETGDQWFQRGNWEEMVHRKWVQKVATCWGEEVATCSQDPGMGRGKEFCKGIDVKLSGFHGIFPTWGSRNLAFLETALTIFTYFYPSWPILWTRFRPRIQELYRVVAFFLLWDFLDVHFFWQNLQILCHSFQLVAAKIVLNGCPGVSRS